MGSEVKEVKEVKEIKFSDEDNLERQNRIQLISSKYRFDKNYDPPEWDPVEDDDFELDETVVVYGQRRQGKSYLVRYLLMKLRKFYPLTNPLKFDAPNGGQLFQFIRDMPHPDRTVMGRTGLGPSVDIGFGPN